VREVCCKLLVLGAGPGGYACAIRAGQLGIDTVLVERERPGGTCLHVGCIPSKALIHAADEFHRIATVAAGGDPLGIAVSKPSLDLGATMAWKDAIVGRLTSGLAGLIERAKVKTIHGRGHFRDGKTVEVDTETGAQVVRAETIVIATGSAPVELPELPFGGNVISSAEALALAAPPATLAIVGAGYIGLELGTVFAKLGTRVTVVEAENRILPQYGAELVRPVARRLAELGVEVLTGARARGLTGNRQSLLVEHSGGESRRVDCEKVLVTVGRRPVTDGWGIEELVLDMRGPFVRIDDRCRTSMRGIHAVGDVTGEPMLAHRALAQGEMVAELVAGRPRAWDKRCVPAVCFTDPEIVTVGLAPDAARATGGGDIVTAQVPFAANGRAMTMAATDGFVRVTARADNHLVLGIEAVGTGVSELSAAFTLAIEMGARLEDVAHTVHAHPTQSEAFHEAARRALGQSEGSSLAI
jgi:dihydrolipoamide dehydrogenase